MRLMIFGLGYSGKEIAKTLDPHCEWTGGTTRDNSNFPIIEKADVQPFQFDGSDLSDSLKGALKTVTHLIISIAPDTKSGDVVLSAFQKNFREIMPCLKWVGYLSTVGVYGHHGGDWIDENTPCTPLSKRSIARLKAEEKWQEASQINEFGLSIIRLSGIYGPGRNALLNLKAGKARRLVKKDQVFNRIHVADIAGAVSHLILNNLSGIWNVTDAEPTPPQDVVSYAAQLLSIEAPQEIDFETAELSPMARSFYGENKRVSNKKISKSGYVFSHPNYRSALNELYQNLT